MREIYGIANHAYYDGANGVVTYYSSRRARDVALTKLRATAIADGLSQTAATSGITAVRRPVRGEASRSWVQNLIDRGSYRLLDGPFYVWEGNND